MSQHLYFAYGSNMSTLRLRARVEAARPLGRAHWPGMELAFDKIGADGSGKANLTTRPGGRAWGVVFEIHANDWDALDRYEPGYLRLGCDVILDSGDRLDAQAYLAVPPTRATPPHDWYREHLIRGAVEHGLPDDALELIDTLERKRQ